MPDILDDILDGKTPQTPQQPVQQPQGEVAYTQDELEGILRQAGWSEDKIPTMSAIGMGESALTRDGRAKLRSFNPGYTTNEKSYGLWQINMEPKLGRKYDKERLLSDPVYNAQVALEIYNGGHRSGDAFNHWGAYSNGRYKKYFRNRASAPQMPQAPQGDLLDQVLGVPQTPNYAQQFQQAQTTATDPVSLKQTEVSDLEQQVNNAPSQMQKNVLAFRLNKARSELQQMQQQTAMQPPMPEAPETLDAQMASTLDPNSPRSAVLLTMDAKISAGFGQAVQGLMQVPTPDGVLFINPQKTGFRTPEEAQAYIQKNGIGQLIGKTFNAPSTAGQVALRTEDADGNELSTSVVRNPQDAEQQAALDRQQFPQAANQEVVNSDEALRRRAEQQLKTLPDALQFDQFGEIRKADENGKYVNADGEEFKVVRGADGFTAEPVGAHRQMRLTSGETLTRSDDQTKIKKKGFIRYSDEKGKEYFVSSDGKQIMTSEELPDYLTDKRPGKTKLPDGSEPGYKKTLADYKLRDTEALRQKYSAAYPKLKEGDQSALFSGEEEALLEKYRPQLAAAQKAAAQAAKKVQGASQAVRPVPQQVAKTAAGGRTEYEFVRTGKVNIPMGKDSVGGVLDYDKTKQDGLKDGEYRVTDKDGNAFIIYPETGKIVDEASTKIVAKVPIELPEAGSMSIGDALGKQGAAVASALYSNGILKEEEVPFGDAVDFFSRNVVDWESKQNLGVERLFRYDDKGKIKTTDDYYVTERDILRLKEEMKLRETRKANLEKDKQAFLSQGFDEQESALLAAKKRGLMTPSTADEELRLYREWRQEQKAGAQRFFDQYAGLPVEFGLLRIFFFGKRDIQSDLNDLLKTYGNFTNRQKAFDRFNQIPYFSKEYGKELAKAGVRWIPNMAAQISRGAGGVLESLGRYAYDFLDKTTLDNLPNTLPKWTPIDKTLAYQAGDGYDWAIKRMGLTPAPEMRFSKLVAGIDGLGQVAGQMFVQYATGGAGTTMAILSQGFADQYKQAKEAKDDKGKPLATEGQAVAMGIVGAIAGAPDIFLTRGWFRALRPLDRASFVRGMLRGALNKLTEALGEKEALTAVRGGLSAMLDRAVSLGLKFLDKEEIESLRQLTKGEALLTLAKGTAFESTQEVLENKIDKTAEKLIYNPSVKWSDIATIDDEDVMSAIGGAAGGLGGGAVEVGFHRIQTNMARKALFDALDAGFERGEVKDGSLRFGDKTYKLNEEQQKTIGEWQKTQEALRDAAQSFVTLRTEAKAAKTVEEKKKLRQQVNAERANIKMLVELRRAHLEELLTIPGFSIDLGQELAGRSGMEFVQKETIPAPEAAPDSLVGQTVTVNLKGKPETRVVQKISENGKTAIIADENGNKVMSVNIKKLTPVAAETAPAPTDEFDEFFQAPKNETKVSEPAAPVDAGKNVPAAEVPAPVSQQVTGITGERTTLFGQKYTVRPYNGIVNRVKGNLQLIANKGVLLTDTDGKKYVTNHPDLLAVSKEQAKVQAEQFSLLKKNGLKWSDYGEDNYRDRMSAEDLKEFDRLEGVDNALEEKAQGLVQEVLPDRKSAPENQPLKEVGDADLQELPHRVLKTDLTPEEIQRFGSNLPMADLGKEVREFEKKNGRKPRIWFWAADNLLRGDYKNATTGAEVKNLDGGLGYGLENKQQKTPGAWATSLADSSLSSKLKDADLIFIVSGSMDSMHYSNMKAVDTVEAEIRQALEASKMPEDTFVKELVKNATRVNPQTGQTLAGNRPLVKQLFLHAPKNLTELFKAIKSTADRGAILQSLLPQSKGSNSSVQKLVRDTGAPSQQDMNERLIQPVSKSNFETGDIILVIKPNGTFGKAGEGAFKDVEEHGTYKTVIGGDVVGVPSTVYKYWDVNPAAKKLTKSGDVNTGQALYSAQRHGLVKGAEELSVPLKDVGAKAADTSVAMEVAPDPNNKELSEKFDALSYDDRREVTDLLGKDFLPRILKLAGINGYKILPTVGGYLDKVNPSISLKFGETVPLQTAKSLAAFIGHIFAQDSVIVASEHIEPNTGKVRVEVPYDLTDDKAKTLYDHLRKLVPEVTGFSTENNYFDILNFSDLSNEDFGEKVRGALDVLPEEYGVNVHEIGAEFLGKDDYAGEIQKTPEIERNANPLRFQAQTKLRTELQFRKPEKRSDTVRVDERRGQTEVSRQSDGDTRGVYGQPFETVDIPGRKGQEAVTYSETSDKPSVKVYAVHYSPSKNLPSLDSSFWGKNESKKAGKQGQAGHERTWVDSSSDDRLKHRIYAYVTSSTVAPKPGLGNNPHLLDLTLPVYDLTADPEGLVAQFRQPRFETLPGMPGKVLVQPSFAEFESAILNAGYSGYISKGLNGVNDALVLLGERRIPLAENKSPLKAVGLKEGDRVTKLVRPRGYVYNPQEFVDKFMNNEYEPGTIGGFVVREGAPAVAQMLGFHNFDFVIAPKELYKVLKDKHSLKLTPEQFKAAEKALDRPLMVYKYKPRKADGTIDENALDGYNFVLPVAGIDGKPLVFGVFPTRVAAIGRNQFVINRIATAHPKTEGGSNQYKFDLAAEAGNVVYVDTSKEAQTFATELALNLATSAAKARAKNPSLLTDKDLGKFTQRSPLRQVGSSDLRTDIELSEKRLDNLQKEIIELGRDLIAKAFVNSGIDEDFQRRSLEQYDENNKIAPYLKDGEYDKLRTLYDRQPEIVRRISDYQVEAEKLADLKEQLRQDAIQGLTAATNKERIDLLREQEAMSRRQREGIEQEFEDLVGRVSGDPEAIVKASTQFKRGDYNTALDILTGHAEYQQALSLVKRRREAWQREIGAASDYQQLEADTLAAYTPPYTLPVLNDPMFKGKEGQQVKIQTLKQVLKQASTKPIEQEILGRVLEQPEFRDSDRVDWDAFKRAVQQELLPLQVIESTSWSSYGLDGVGLSNADSSTHIYNTELDHGRKGHFTNDFDRSTPGNWEVREVTNPNTNQPVFMAVRKGVTLTEQNLQENVGTATATRERAEQWIAERSPQADRPNVGLYGHTRVAEDGTDTYVTEMQSDAYQKNSATTLVVDSYLNKLENGKLLKSNPMYEKTEDLANVRRELASAPYSLRELHSNSVTQFAAVNSGIEDYTKTVAKMEEMRPLVEKYSEQYGKAKEDRQLDWKETGEGDLIAKWGDVAYRIAPEGQDFVPYKKVGSEPEERLVRHSFYILDGAKYYVQSLVPTAHTLAVGEIPNFEALTVSDQNAILGWSSGASMDFYRFMQEVNMSAYQTPLAQFDRKLEVKKKAIESYKTQREELIKETQTPEYEQYDKNKKLEDKLLKQFIDALPLKDKQFIAHRKNYVTRLLREEIRRAAVNGQKRLLIPTPRTAAIIEGYISNGGAMPYETNQYYLSPGDTISHGGEEFTVVSAGANTFRAVQANEVEYESYEEWEEREREYYREELNGLSKYDGEELTAEEIDAAFGQHGFYISEIDLKVLNRVEPPEDGDERKALDEIEKIESDITAAWREMMPGNDKITEEATFNTFRKEAKERGQVYARANEFLQNKHPEFADRIGNLILDHSRAADKLDELTPRYYFDFAKLEDKVFDKLKLIDGRVNWTGFVDYIETTGFKHWFDAEDGDATGAYYTTERYANEVVFDQPSEYEDTAGDIESFNLNDFSDEQKTILKKYEEVNKLFKKERPDAETVEKDGAEWLATDLTPEDAGDIPLFHYGENNTREAKAYQERLKNTTDKSSLLPAVESMVQEDGDLKISLEAAEILRVVAAKAFGGDAYNDPTLNGMFFEPSQVDRLIKKLEVFAKAAAKHTNNAPIVELIDNIRKAASKAQGTVNFVIFEDARLHEKFHQTGYLGAAYYAKPLNNRIADLTGFISKHRAIIQKAYDNFFKKHHYAPTDTPIFVEEIATYIATDRFDRFGLTTREADDYLFDWFTAYEKQNGADSLKSLQNITESFSSIQKTIKEDDNAKQNRHSEDLGKGSNLSKHRPESDGGATEGGISPQDGGEPESETSVESSNSLQGNSDGDGGGRVRRVLSTEQKLRSLPVFHYGENNTREAKAYQERLKNTTDKSSLLPAVESMVQEDGDLKISLEAAEILRDEAAKAFGGDAYNDPTLNGMFFEPSQVDRLLSKMESLKTTLANKGIDVAPLQKFIDNIRSAAKKADGTVNFVVYEDARAHEKFHQVGYLNAKAYAKPLHNRIAGMESFVNRHKAIIQTAYDNHFGRYGYDPTDTPTFVEEIATYLATGDRSRLGLSEEEAAEYLVDWFDAYEAQNGEGSADDLRAVMQGFYNAKQAIKESYDEKSKTELQPGTTSEAEGNDGSLQQDQEPATGGTSRGDEEAASPGGKNSEPGLGAEQTDAAKPAGAAGNGLGRVLSGKQKLRSLPETIREAGLDAADAYYDIFSNDEAARIAQTKLNRLGLQGAIAHLETMKTATDKADATLSFAVQGILRDEAAKADADNPKLAAELRLKANELAAHHAELATKAGQFNQAAAVIAQTRESVVYSAAKAAAKAKKQLTQKQTRKFESLGEQAEDLNAKIAALKAENSRLKKRVKELDSGETKAAPVRVSSPASRAVIDRAKKKLGIESVSGLIDKLKAKLAGTPTKMLGGAIGATNLDASEASVERFDKLMEAKRRMAAGRDPGNIWRNLGWEQGADGKWRFEIPDAQATEAFNNLDYKDDPISLEKALTGEGAEMLFKAYPELRGVTVKINKSRTEGGFLDWKNKTIEISTYLPTSLYTVDAAFHRVLLHEIQHAIQFIEGFTPGSNPEYIQHLVAQRVQRKMLKLSETKEGRQKVWKEGDPDKVLYELLKKRLGELRSGKTLNTYVEQYRKVAGEVEARNVEMRSAFDEKTRSVTRPQLTEDVPRTAQLTPQGNPLKSVGSDNLADFAKVGAAMLLDKPLHEIDRKSFTEDLVKTFGEEVRGDAPQIYAESFRLRNEMLKEARMEAAKEKLSKKYPEKDAAEIDKMIADAEKTRQARFEQGLLAKKLASLYKPEVAAQKRNIAERVLTLTDDPEVQDMAVRIVSNDVNPNDIRSASPSVVKEAQNVIAQATKQLADEKRERQARAAGSKEDLKELQREEFFLRKAQKENKAEIARALADINRGTLGRAFNVIAKVGGEMRSLMASGDLSGVMRQGFYFNVTDTGAMLRGSDTLDSAFKALLHSFGKNNFADAMTAIESHPDFDTMVRSGIEFAEAGTGKGMPTQAEEQIRTEYAKKVPLLRGWLDRSERTYAGYLDQQRALMAEKIFGELQAAGKTFDENPEEYEAAAYLINIATGRGQYSENAFTKAFNGVAGIFFAPGYLISRFQLLGHLLGLDQFSLPPAMRKIAAKRVLRFHSAISLPLLALGAASALGYISLVSLDPDDDDFLKIKVGSKARYEFLAGMQPIIRLLGRFVKHTYEFAHGDIDRTKYVDTMTRIMLRFGYGKLAPIPGLAVDYVRQKNYMGEPFAWFGNKSFFDGEIASRILPLSPKDIIQGAMEDGLPGVALTLPSITGLGVQYYADTPKPSKPTDAVKEFHEGKLQKVDAEKKLDEAVQTGQMTRQGRADAERRLNLSAEEDAMEQTGEADDKGLKKLEEVLQKTRPEARRSLLPILMKKIGERYKDGSPKALKEAEALEKLRDKYFPQ